MKKIYTFMPLHTPQTSFNTSWRHFSQLPDDEFPYSSVVSAEWLMNVENCMIFKIFFWLRTNPIFDAASAVNKFVVCLWKQRQKAMLMKFPNQWKFVQACITSCCSRKPLSPTDFWLVIRRFLLRNQIRQIRSSMSTPMTPKSVQV